MSGKVDFRTWNQQQKKTRERLVKKRNQNRGGKGGGKTPAWVYRMKWFRTRDIKSTWVRLQPHRPGQPWFEWYSKWVQIGEKAGKPVRRQIISNSRNGELPVPCVLYYYLSQEEVDTLWANGQYAISLVDLTDYHKIPRVSKGGSTYYVYERCTKGSGKFNRNNCEMCAEGVETVPGNQFYWSMFPTSYREFTEQLEDLATRCQNCKTGVIIPYAYKCGECGHSFGNHYQAEIPSDYEDQLLSEPIACPNCEHEGMAVQEYECNHRSGRGEDASYSEGCDNPVKYDGEFDPYNVDLKIAFELVGKNLIPRIVDWRPATELREEIQRPLDLDYFLGKMDLEEQAKQMNRENPFDDDAQKILDAYKPTSADEEDNDSIPFDA